MSLIHPSAYVSSKAELGIGVSIGPFSVIHDDVILGAGTQVDAYCELGYPTKLAKGVKLVVGDHSLIRSHSVFYQGSKFGPGLRTGHRVTVREKTTAGEGLQIGTLCDIQGDCTIGNHVRMHSNVHVGKGSSIEDFVWLFPYVVLTNDPHPPSEVFLPCVIERYAVVATMSVILPGVRVGQGALVGAHSSVSKDVAPRTVVAGSPAKYICEAERIKLRAGDGGSAYPWTRHFERGYPAEIVEKWKVEGGYAG